MPSPYDVWLAGEIDDPRKENKVSAIKEWQIAIMEGLAEPEASWVEDLEDENEELPF